ncbi:hypothetical protein PORY_002311 [Pneumocystis oryctolagi]|uniref:Uncharacterized protein n=1 Tax=Pneumocystis oryctolagi TaxID=42067 RepID=A0ACB7C9G2_9ASCO|nr:hypothetical protein PORY_002311 [Pneumocystis oryctolagi]
MKNEKMENLKIEKELEKNALKLLKKNFEDQFGSIHRFFGVKKSEKEIQNPTLLENVSENENIEEIKNFKESPEIVSFLENTKDSMTVINNNTHFHCFKTSKVSDFFEKKSRSKSSEKKNVDDDWIKNDFALQRLLEETRFLKRGSDSSTFSLQPTGKQRHKIIENRVKLLGGKDVFKEKIPFKIRLGMKLKAKIRSDISKKKAKEAGIVRALCSSKWKAKRKRNHGLNEITIGKYRKGMVILSKKDIRETSSTVSDKKSKGYKNNK